MVTTPAPYVEQDAICENELEIHRSFWRPTDFSRLGKNVSKITENDILVAVLLKNDTPASTLRSFTVRGHRQKRNVKAARQLAKRVLRLDSAGSKRAS